jgi:hypothetical protein
MSRKDQMWYNLKLELDQDYIPMQNLLINIAQNSKLTYDDAVVLIKSHNINAPCFIVLANHEDQGSSSKYGQGIIIARGRTSVDHTSILSTDL